MKCSDSTSALLYIFQKLYKPIVNWRNISDLDHLSYFPFRTFELFTWPLQSNIVILLISRVVRKTYHTVLDYYELKTTFFWSYSLHKAQPHPKIRFEGKIEELNSRLIYLIFVFLFDNSLLFGSDIEEEVWLVHYFVAYTEVVCIPSPITSATVSRLPRLLAPALL